MVEGWGRRGGVFSQARMFVVFMLFSMVRKASPDKGSSGSLPPSYSSFRRKTCGQQGSASYSNPNLNLVALRRMLPTYIHLARTRKRFGTEPGFTTI